MATVASATAVYGAVVATLALLVAAAALTWNIINAIREARERRAPDVHGVVVTDAASNQSVLIFANAGRGIARHLFYLLSRTVPCTKAAFARPFSLTRNRLSPIASRLLLSRREAPWSGHTWTPITTFMRAATAAGDTCTRIQRALKWAKSLCASIRAYRFHLDPLCRSLASSDRFTAFRARSEPRGVLLREHEWRRREGL
jgi:hypothetical protein